MCLFLIMCRRVRACTLVHVSGVICANMCDCLHDNFPLSPASCSYMSPLSSSAELRPLNPIQKRLIQCVGLNARTFCWWVERCCRRCSLGNHPFQHRRLWEVGHEEGEKVLREDFHLQKVTFHHKIWRACLA